MASLFYRKKKVAAVRSFTWHIGIVGSNKWLKNHYFSAQLSHCFSTCIRILKQLFTEVSVASGGNFKERMIILSRTVFVWNWKYLCLVWPTVYTYEVKTISKNAFFSNILPRVDWKWMLIVFVWTDGKGGLRIRWCHTSYSAFSERDAIVIPSF